MAGALVPVLLYSCSGEEGKIRRQAAEAGREAAITLVGESPSMTSFELEGYLLGVRATEQEYREQGHDKAADRYVDAFEEYIKQNSDTLANILF